MGDTNDTCHLADAGDPDVAGLGVTVAFLVSICLTAVIIIALYFRHGLDPHLYSHIDKDVINKLNPKRNRPHNAIVEPFNDTLRKFLVTLSDQQLAGGLSLAVVVYIRFARADTFSAYSFQMATSTVFMSCISHMSTLAALPDVFRTGAGRLPRVIAMVTLALLTIPILIMSNFPSYFMDLSLSLKCARNQFSTYPSTERTSAILVSFSITLMLIAGYVTRIYAVYTRKPPSRLHASAEWSPRFSVPIYHKTAHLFEDLKSTFFWELLSLAFYYTFGLLMLITTWTGLPPLTQWSLSFGQLLPAGLLLWSFIPAYSDYLNAQRQRGEEDSSMRNNPPTNKTRRENNTIDGVKRGETLRIHEYPADNKCLDLILPQPTEHQNEDIVLKNGSHIDSIEFSPSPSSFTQHQGKVENNAAPTAVPPDISPEELHCLCRFPTSILVSAFLIKFVFGEFLALLLGGALTALGSSFNLFALLICLLLRSSVQGFTLVLLRRRLPLVRYLQQVLRERSTWRAHSADQRRDANVRV